MDHSYDIDLEAVAAFGAAMADYCKRFTNYADNLVGLRSSLTDAARGDFAAALYEQLGVSATRARSTAAFCAELRNALQRAMEASSNMDVSSAAHLAQFAAAVRAASTPGSLTRGPVTMAEFLIEL